MEYIEQFQLNIFAFIILVILFVIIQIRLTIESFGRKILHLLILCTILAIVIEPLTWIFDGKFFMGAYFLEYSTNVLLIILGPVITGLMLSYVDYYVSQDRKAVAKKIYYMHGALFTVLMLIINAFTPIYFLIEKSSNTYVNGDLIYIHYIVLFIMYLYMIVNTLTKKSRISKNLLIMFMLFFLVPFIGMIIQIININIFFSWNSIVLGIFVVYIFIESNNDEKDYLSKLYNRRSYEKYVKQLSEVNTSFSIILIDLDKFKTINDRYGHLEGDKTLIAFGKVIKKVALPNKMVARLGGDEFVIVLEQFEKMDTIIGEIYQELRSLDSEIMKNITFSFGCFEYKEHRSLDELYALADKEMYLYKNRNGALKRRKTD